MCDRQCANCACQPPIKIMLAGKFRSGKDVAAGYLALHYGFRPYAFADELKDAFHRAFPNVPRTPKPRTHYVKFGEWGCEVFGNNVWIDRVFAKIESDNSPFVIVTDMRKEPEYEAARKAGFIIVKVTADDEIRRARAVAAGDQFTDADMTHPTETFIDNITANYTVENSGSIEEMTAQLDVIMRKLNIRMD
jgi:hypothetical protein